MIVWIVGPSGAGKSTLGRALLARLPKHTVFLDGDLVRRAFGDDLGHDLEGRRKNAFRFQGLCDLLDEQGFHVVAAILAIFPEVLAENRRRWGDRYYEVFLDVPLEELERRDPKGLYRAAREGRARNVVGVDIPFARPENPDYVVENPPSEEALLSHVEKILEGLPLP